LKEYSAENIRNIAVIGHSDSGKTIFVEAAMFDTGVTNRIGRIEDGTTISDYHPDEISRQISINSTLLSCEYHNTKLNFIDTPGFPDFVGEVTSALRVADAALLVLKAFEGVEVGSELVWKNAAKYKTPIFFVVNKMDHANADFNAVLEAAKSAFGTDVIAAQIPLNKGEHFDQVIDLIRMKLLTFSQDGDGKYTETDIPAEHLDEANARRDELVEKVAESSEELMNLFFEHGTLPEEDLRRGFRSSMQHRQIFPVFCCSALHNRGVSRILEFISNFGPTPLEHGSAVGRHPDTGEEIVVEAKADGEPVLFVYKTATELHVGEMSFFRVYSGMITSGLELVNRRTGKIERINQVYAVNGKERKEVPRLVAGDLGAVVKLKETRTNDTLSSKAFPVILPPIEFPEPIITGAIKPKSKGDEDKISTALKILHEEDPNFLYKYDDETHETVISGQGEIHLDVMVQRLKERFSVDVDLSQPRIPYRETIRGKTEVSYKHKKQTGGAGQYGEVYLRLEPLPRGSGYEFVNAIVGGVISGKFIPAVDKGIREIMERGVLAGYRVVDVRVTLFDGSQHSVDSNEISFKTAAIMAFKKGFLDCKPILLEPVYEVQVTVPEEYMGDVMGDVSSRRGKILGMDTDGHFQIIKALIPLAELYQYATSLRSMTQGRGIYTRRFSHYEEMPPDVQKKIIEEAQKAKENES